MTSEVFNELLSYIEMDIAEQARVLRETIPAKWNLQQLFIIYPLEGVSHIYRIYFVFVELL